MNRTLMVVCRCFCFASFTVDYGGAWAADAGQGAPIGAPAPGILQYSVQGGWQSGSGFAVGAGFLCVGDAVERAALAVGGSVEEYAGRSCQDAD